MKKIVVLMFLSILMTVTDASAQLFGFGRKTENKEAVAEVKAAPVVQAVKTEDNTLQEEPIKSIPVKLSDAEKEEIDNNLRDSLRDTVKKDELAARVEYLEADNYVDRVKTRQRLLHHSGDFKISSHAARSMKKANVNPKDNAQMNEYILNRAGVGDKK